jgi:hypothetical protein
MDNDHIPFRRDKGTWGLPRVQLKVGLKWTMRHSPNCRRGL